MRETSKVYEDGDGVVVVRGDDVDRAVAVDVGQLEVVDRSAGLQRDRRRVEIADSQEAVVGQGAFDSSGEKVANSTESDGDWLK